MISVCIATYNGEKYIKEQIDSILAQLNSGDEIIVSDDSSQDSTIEIIQSYNDPRIKIHPYQQFHSPVLNFENAINKATGDYIFLCDQDDVWLPNKVELMIKSLQHNDLVLSNCIVVDASLQVIHESFFSLNKTRKGFWVNLYKNSYIGCCMAFRKHTLKYILPFPKGIAMHDLWIGLCVEAKGSTALIQQPLLLYRRHGNNVSQSSEKSKNKFIYKIWYRLLMLHRIIHRLIRL